MENFICPFHNQARLHQPNEHLKYSVLYIMAIIRSIADSRGQLSYWISNSLFKWTLAVSRGKRPSSPHESVTIRTLQPKLQSSFLHHLCCVKYFLYMSGGTYQSMLTTNDNSRQFYLLQEFLGKKLPYYICYKHMYVKLVVSVKDIIGLL